MKKWLIDQYEVCLDEIRTRFSPFSFLYLLILSVIAACYRFYFQSLSKLKLMFCKSSGSPDDK